MITRYFAGSLLLAAAAAFAQTAPALPSFEVASVKPAPPPTDGRMMVRMGGDPGRVDYSNVSLKDLLSRAYEVKRFQISGPSWLETERFDVTAKVPDGTPREQVPLMLQQLLNERFKMAVHKEKKEMPVYALVVGRGGPKLQKSAETPLALPPDPGVPGAADGRGGRGPSGFLGGGRGMIRIGGGKIEAKQVTLGSFADMLANFLDRPVVDETKLEGNYDISMDVSMEEMAGMRGLRMGAPPQHDGGAAGAGPAAGPAPDSTPGASIFTAVQQLGLKLEPRKAPMDLVVIDHSEKVPTEN
jgi:uncharacterized protein (TIGR03435 family)